jgi:arsenate reductase
MAEGFLKSFDHTLEVYSAGTRPEKEVNPRSVQVMKELGIDLSGNKPEHVDRYIQRSFDYVITVCDGAREICPVFTGDVKHKIHIGFEDPAEARGSDEEVLAIYRKIRDEIQDHFLKFYNGLN